MLYVLRSIYLLPDTNAMSTVGTKLAKLEITIAVAFLVAMFDYELVNLDGTERTGPLPKTNHNSNTGVEPMTGKVFLKLHQRFDLSA